MLATAALALLAAAPGSQETRPAANPAVTRAELEACVRFLASDELAGRSTGSPEAERAAAYLAEVLAASGVEPAGDDGKFLQAVPLRRTESTRPPELTLVARTASGSPETIQPVSGRDFEPPSGPVVVRDLRIVVAKSAGEIPVEGSAGVAIFVDAFSTDARRWLEQAGHPNGSGFGLWIQAGSKTAGEEKPFRPGPRGGLEPALSRKSSTPSVRIRGPLLERLRRQEIERLSLDTHVEVVAVRAFNVVGRLRGAGLSAAPDLAMEAVVLSAHYDHLPPKPRAPASNDGAQAEDLIFNGADDDASGCAALLEIAGALAAGAKPARTVVFLLATGEEVGLLGTEAYLDHPVVPLERTVANLNIEMVGRPDPMVGGAGKVWLTGFDRTDLGKACAAAGLPVVADPRLDQHFYERSDNFAFVLRNVIGQTFSTYNLHDDYHHTSDEADLLDYAHLEECTKAVLGAVRLVVDGKLRPRWIEAPAREPR